MQVCIIESNSNQMSGQPPNISTRLPSIAQKREVMWNIIEPGDPYDIRKSMIAKLPGRRNFMGEHLELVCLLQAAEIQRLCQYLDEYRLKFREVERRELDRHSYQVQIKELTMRISDEGNFKAENVKLRQFLRKQSAEFEQLRKHLASAGDEAQLARKYQESLKQVEALINENEQLTGTLLRSRQDYEQIITNKNLEVEELQRRLKERQSGVSVGRGEAYRLDVQFKKLELENRRLREIGDARTRELEQVHVKCKHLIDQVEGQEAQMRQNSALHSTIHQYESRFTLLTQEIQRLNKVLRDKTNQLDEISTKLRNVEEERRRQSNYLAELQGRLGQLEEQNHRLQGTLKEVSSSNSAIDESRTIMRAYQGNLEKLSTEIARLNRVLKTKMDELESAEHRASQAEQELRRAEGARREADEYRSRFSELNRKMADYENRIALTTQEIQRLNLVLRRKLEQNSALEEQLKSRTQALEHSESLKSQLEIAYNTQNEYLTKYQTRIEQLEREAQRQVANTATRNEIERLNALLFSKNSEIQHMQASLQSSRDRDSPNKQVVANLESELGAARQANLTMQRSLQQYEQRIILLSQEIDRLNIVIKKASQPPSPAGWSEDQLDQRKVTEYENKLAILSQEIERLDENLRAKDGKIRLYQQEISLLRRPQETLSNNTQQTERLAEAEHRITLCNAEIQRLNGLLAQQSQTINSFELKISTSARESEDLRRQLAQYEQSIEEITQKSKVIPQAAQVEIDALKRRLTEQERRVSEAQAMAREAEFNHRSAVQQSFILEQQVRSYQQREGKLTQGNAKYREYEPKLAALSQEVERLNTILERLTNDNQDLKRKLFQANSLKDSLTALEEKLAIAAQENQGLRKNLSEGQKSTLLLNQNYQAKLAQANTEREQARRRIQDLESNLQALLAQFEIFKRAKSRQQSELSIRETKFQEILVQNEILLKKADQLTVANRKTADLEDRINLASEEIDRLTSLLRTRTNEARALDEKCRAYQLELGNYQRKVGDLENSTIRELQTKNAAFSRENEELRARVRQLTAEGARVNEFENKLALSLGEVERLNSVLKAKVNEIDQLNARQRALEADLERARKRNEDLETTMHRELKNQSAVFQQRITHLSEENETFRRSARQLAETNRKIPELEHQLSLSNAELERLNTILIKYSRETVPALEEKTRLLALECDEQRRRCVELGQGNKQGAEAAARARQLTSDNQQLQRRLQEYQNKIGFISAEVERLNGVLRGKLDELAGAQAKLRQSQADNEHLSKRYKDSAQVAKRIHDYEAKLAQLGQEMERLNGLLRSRVEELASAQSRIRILEHQQESLQRRLTDQQALTLELKKHRSGLQDKLTATAVEKEELRKTIRELSDANRRLADYENRLLLLSQEVERLSTNLKTKTDQLSESENNLRALRREADNKIASLSAELEEYRRRASENMGQQATRLAEYENKMVLLSKEIERLNVVLKQTTYQVQTSKGREKQYIIQIERLNNTLRLKVEETVRWEQAHTDLKTKLRNSQEALTASYSESQKWRQQYLQLVEEHKTSNQHIAEYEKSINKLYQEFERLQSIIQNLKKENYDLKTSRQEAGNLIEKNRALSAEIDRLLKVIQHQTADLEELRLTLADQSALQKRISEYMALMVILFAETQSLRIRVKDTEKEIADVRRSSLAPFKV